MKHSMIREKNMTSSRNLQCIPSDDESDQDDISIYSSSDHDESIINTKRKNTRAKMIVKIIPPSHIDSESKYNKLIENPLNGSLPYRVNRSAPSLAQLLPQKKQYRHSHPIQPKDKSISIEDLKRSIGHEETASTRPLSFGNQQQQRPSSTNNKMPMSGMDLLIQREQRKAETKRQKPRMDMKNPKIQGLLSKLPEPGIHNINFQSVEQKQPSTPVPNKQKRHSQKQQQQQQQQQMYYQQMMYYPMPMYMMNPVTYSQQLPDQTMMLPQTSKPRAYHNKV